MTTKRPRQDIHHDPWIETSMKRDRDADARTRRRRRDGREDLPESYFDFGRRSFEDEPVEDKGHNR